MKILSGIHQPTSGEIQLGESTYKALTPDLSKKFGIRLIYQELSVIDYLSIEEKSYYQQIVMGALIIGTVTADKIFGKKK